MNRRKVKYAALALLLLYMAALLALCLARPEEFPQISSEWFGLPADKVAHFLMFFPFPSLAWIAFDNRRHGMWRRIGFAVLIFISGMAVAGGTEYLQGLTDYRDADIKDFEADCLGMAAGLAATVTAMALAARRKKEAVALLVPVLLLSSSLTGSARSTIVKDFDPVCDSLSTVLKDMTGVSGNLKIKAIMKRGNSLDFYFTESLGDFPWHGSQAKEFRSILKSLFPEKYSRYKVGEIYSRMVPLSRLLTPSPGFDGTPSKCARHTDTPSDRKAFVHRMDGFNFGRGLQGRTITLWQSHGKYYDVNSEKWAWQRPRYFQTVEDLFTQGFVLDYLVPMLENAGGYVMLPRERDFRKEEIIADNDSSWVDSGDDGSKYGYAITGPARSVGKYYESGTWTDAGEGFGDRKAVWSDDDNPFTQGTARMTGSLPYGKGNSCRAVWKPEVKVKGDYAVYVSYKSLENSTEAAHYTVYHGGGQTSYVVNQKMGGGIWVYLGTFTFEGNADECVVLDAAVPKGYRHVNGTVVTADAVKFGGGMGNIERGGSVSGLPRNSEAARYFLQWSGADSGVWYLNEGKDDYKDDYCSRGDWSAWLSGGSQMNPKADGKGIPVDLCFGLHSDAGTAPGDSIIGTLAIYTLKSEGSSTLPSKEDRMTSRDFADMVQSQIVNDVRTLENPNWTQRQIWDRGYRESRTPTAPSMLLELLSHQNFADMKYGRDPEFEFIASRAIYKGMLKYLSNRYDIPYTVQPLPVGSMALRFTDGGDNVEISWSDTVDSIEQTAVPTGYILYTRVDGGAFDSGHTVEAASTDDGRKRITVNIGKGHIYSWKIVAFNDGGLSFPSEILSAGIPEDASTDSGNILIVNNFYRVGPGAIIDTPEYAGFDDRTDRGVAYIRDIAYIGDMYNFNRSAQWLANDNQGFGASYSDFAGNPVAGNTFDYAAVHGRAVMKTGRPFLSCSAKAVCQDSTLTEGCVCIDLVCGKQITSGRDSLHRKYTVFTEELQEAIRSFTSHGGNIIASGAFIGTDSQNGQNILRDSTALARTRNFTRNILGFKHITGHASRVCRIREAKGTGEELSFWNCPNSDVYCVESPDALAPASGNAETIMRYSDTGTGACIGFRAEGYSSVCFGFPIETLCDEKQIDRTISSALDYIFQNHGK